MIVVHLIFPLHNIYTQLYFYILSTVSRKSNLCVFVCANLYFLSIFLQMCIAGGLGIPASTPQRTQRRNYFVSKTNGLSVTAWGLLCADWEKSLTDILAYSPKFEIALDTSEPLCMSSHMLTWQLHQHIMHYMWAYRSHGDSLKTIALWIFDRITPTKTECFKENEYCVFSGKSCISSSKSSSRSFALNV